MGGVFAEGFCVLGMGLHGVDLGFWKLAFEVERRESHIGPTVHNPPHIFRPIKIVLAMQEHLRKRMHVLKSLLKWNGRSGTLEVESNWFSGCST